MRALKTVVRAFFSFFGTNISGTKIFPIQEEKRRLKQDYKINLKSVLHSHVIKTTKYKEALHEVT